ncbi:MAG: peptidase [bacterium]|nr:MAG: peptidase [bacterium]
MIDFSFISELEGGRRTTGYVPEPDTSRSGVTIATGVDLGQMGESDLEQLDLPDELKAKLRPYLGLIKFDAIDILNAQPLEVTLEEAEQIDREVKSRFLNTLARKYQNETNQFFENLPIGVRTVIASVAFQYGDLASQTPNFWRQVTIGDWQGAYQNLRNFGDSYSTRRNKEADLLRESLEDAGLASLA